MQDTIDLIIQYGYIILFLYSLGGGFVALIAASVLSYAEKMDLGLCMLTAAVANFLGDMLLFYLARVQKTEVLKYLQKHRRKLALTHILMKKYGPPILILKKYIYGIKTLVPLAAGLTHFNVVKFTLLNAIGAIIWSVSIGAMGYFLGEFFIAFFDFLSDNSFIMPLFVVLVFGGLWWWLSRSALKTKIR